MGLHFPLGQDGTPKVQHKSEREVDATQVQESIFLKVVGINFPFQEEVV